MIREGMRSDNALNDHDGGTGILSKQEPFTLFRAGTGGGNHSQQFETWREKIEPIVQETGTVLLILTLHRVSYLQYHLSRSSKMRKPFDVVTESEIKNSADGGQTLILTNPYMRERTVCSTYPRGQLPRVLSADLH